MLGARTFYALTLFSAVDCGMVAGIFLPFSTFAIRGLARLPPAQGAAAMQSVNLMVARGSRVVDPWFGVVFMGTSGLCFFETAISVPHLPDARAVFLVTGGVLFLLGNAVVTLLFNIPLNDALAVVEPSSAGGMKVWARFLHNWTIWNHVRVATAFLAAMLFVFSLLR
jgi:uncharacterized membrane protein